MSFISELEKQFVLFSDKENAFFMSKYMKNNFVFFGIKSEKRKELIKKVYQENQQEVVNNSKEIAIQLFGKPEREFHYCALELLIKLLHKKFIKDDIHLIQSLLTTNSWWDSVDSCSKYLLGGYLQSFPEQRNKVISQFSNSGNKWLIRSTLLFQLGYKQQTDSELLFSQCKIHADAKDFFIQKAIGWALREYGKTNPNTVIHFVSITNLKPLSKKEALKNIVQAI